MDMPNFGDLNSPANTHVAAYYIQNSATDIDVPNMVTGILASYRGFDTLGETAVVFTAGIGVLVLLSGLARRRREDKEEP
jgi:multicomponent Na+:H+ antiporter subunit B